MDQETKFALISVYGNLKAIAAQAYEAHALALALMDQANERDPEGFEQRQHTSLVTEVRLQAAHLQVSLDAAIARLQE
jgi:hypothetical protein